MSKEILFRGKRVDNGEWIEGLPYKAKYGGISAIVNENEERFVIIPKTLGQYIGLTDKKGKRVFESDIVIFNKGRNLPNTECVPHAIFYDERNVQFTIYASPYATLQKDMMTECEVIGNIHDWENKKSID